MCHDNGTFQTNDIYIYNSFDLALAFSRIIHCNYTRASTELPSKKKKKKKKTSCLDAMTIQRKNASIQCP
jgi:hypothetical protein